MTKQKRARALPCTFAVIMVLALAACGSGGSGTAAGGAPVKIGMLVAKTGLNSAASAPTTAVVDAWTKWVNGKGGVGGRQVQVVVEDTAANPVTALTKAKDLVQKQQVVAVILQDAASEGAVGGYLQDNNVAVIGAAGFDPSVWSVRPNYVTVITTPPAIHQAHSAAAAALGATRLLSVVCAEVPSCAQAATNVANESAGLGQAVEGSAKISASEPNYTALCLSAIQKQVQYIAAALTPDVSARLGSDCLRQGYQGSIGVTALLPQRADAVPGVKFAGGLFAFPWWADAPPVAEYRTVMGQNAPEADIRSPYMTATWTTLQLFAKTIDRVKPAQITAGSVMDAYHTIKAETLDGLLPQPLTLTAGAPAPQVRCFWLFRYTSGDKQPVSMTFGPSGNGATGGLASSCNRATA